MLMSQKKKTNQQMQVLLMKTLLNQQTLEIKLQRSTNEQRNKVIPGKNG